MIYLDSAATALRRPAQVERAMREALKRAGGAGRGGHEASLKATEIIYSCREEAARFFLMSNPERVVFTSNCTHSLNIAIRSLAKPGKRALVSGFEHNSVIRPLNALSREIGLKPTILPTPLFEPEVAFHLFEEAIGEDVCLVVCTHVSNVFGYELPVMRIYELCRRRGVPLVIDAAQSAGCIPINGDSGPIWCMPGHKGLFGPQGTGLLLLPEGVGLSPFMHGGTGSKSSDPFMPDFLPDSLEAGTPNSHGIAGLKEGIAFASSFNAAHEHSRELLRLAAADISAIRGVRAYTAEHLFCQSGALSFTVRGLNPEKTAELLAREGICVRGGLHCAPIAHKTADTYPEGTVRMSVSPVTRQLEVREFCLALQKICKHNINLTI